MKGPNLTGCVGREEGSLPLASRWKRPARSEMLRNRQEAGPAGSQVAEVREGGPGQ